MSKADIIMCVPSYRDPDIVQTCLTALEGARYKVRIVVALQDDDTGREDALRALGVNLLTVKPSQSRGCGWARALAFTLWEGEHWYYQCDSHMIFEEGWDAHYISQQEMLPTPGVLSVHPMSNRISPYHSELPTSYIRGIRPDWGIMAQIRRVPSWGNKPVITRCLSGGNQFMPSSIPHNVPLDPFYFYAGEETGAALRYWTHGYDLWHPGEKFLVRHISKPRRRSSAYWFEFPDSPRVEFCRQRTAARIQALMRGDLVAGYSLGKERSISEYQEHCGVNFSDRTFLTEQEWKEQCEYANKQVP